MGIPAFREIDIYCFPIIHLNYVGNVTNNNNYLNANGTQTSFGVLQMQQVFNRQLQNVSLFQFSLADLNNIKNRSVGF